MGKWGFRDFVKQRYFIKKNVLVILCASFLTSVRKWFKSFLKSSPGPLIFFCYVKNPRPVALDHKIHLLQLNSPILEASNEEA